MQTVEVNSFKQVDIGGLKVPIVTVYNSPEDYPGKCVARIFDCEKPTNTVIVKDTIEEIREDITAAFPYMLPFARSAADKLSIVETWI